MADIFKVDRTNNTITLGTTGTVTTIPFLTASKLLALDGSKNIVSTDLNSWVAGTANQITVTDDGDGTITLSTPQSIHAGASPQFTGIELGHASDTTITRVSAGVVAIEGTNIAMVGGAHHDGFSDFVANEHIDHTSVTLTAGTGLTGGGDISSNRTFAVDGLLEDLDTLGANSADSEFLVGTGAGALAWESGATVRTSIGLGTTDNPQLAGLGIGVAATAGTLVVRSLGADGEDIFVVERATSDLLVFNYLDNAGTDSCALELKRGGSTLINLSTRSTDDSYFNMAGGLVIGGTDAKTKLTVEGTLTLKEQAAADGDTAAYGQLWVKTVTPNQLWFTDDAGIDIPISFTSKCSVYRNGDQEISGSTETKVEFNAENYDVDGEFDHTGDYDFTATSAGYYHIDCLVTLLDPLNEVDQYWVKVLQNATAIIQSEERFGGTYGGRNRPLSKDVYMAATDTITVSVYHTNAADRTLSGDDAYTYLTIHRFA